MAICYVTKSPLLKLIRRWIRRILNTTQDIVHLLHIPYNMKVHFGGLNIVAKQRANSAVYYFPNVCGCDKCVLSYESAGVLL